MADIKAPELTGRIDVPAVSEGASAEIRPHVAGEALMTKIGFPGKLVDDWQARAIEKMGDLLSKYRSLQVFLDICVQCGSCTDKCHYFLGTGDPKNMPVARQELLRSVYRRYFTPGGKYVPGWVGARDLTEDVLKEWFVYFHQCSQCRRCSVFCPYGIDTAEISMAAREIMDSIGMGQKYSNEIIGKVHTIGNNLGIPDRALADTLETLEEEAKESTNVDVKLPLNVKGADVLLVTPSADFFSEPHVEGLVGYAKVFHQAGISWTLSSYASEAANFGLFIGNYDNMRKIAQRIRQAAIDLGVKRIVIGECGHAWRVAYSFLNTLAGPWDFLDSRYPVPQHVCEVTYDLINRGALKLDPTANDQYTVTFHDSCNVARASRMGDRPGGQFEIPRGIVKAVANKFVEMDPETTRDRTFCCGGGGGLLTDELLDLRVKGAMPRMQALKRVMDSDGVNYMASICAICKAQFTKIMPYYKVPRETIGGVHQLVSNAIVLGAKE
ncbi:MAG: (Fe-S)-binding protein [Nitrospirae bacterium]|nr:(Fe-S)-binding protein [Nitrospirota bacterium]